MAYLETDEDAIKLAFAIVNNTKPKDAPSGGDKFWDDSSVLLISALILYLMYEAPASEQNFSTLMYMILNCQVSENEMVENPLMMLFGELERRDPQHPAVLQFKSFMLGAKKTLQSILISAAANLYMFNSRKFAEMTSRDEMFLPRMGLEQRALFIVLPDNDTTFNFIATILYTQLFDQLFRLADSTPEYNGALPVHVRLMMDEFANVALPKNFKNILAVCRSRNISCDIVLQNIAQLKSLFKDDWEGIIGNCDTLLYLGGNEYGTYEYLSKILGKETERTKSQSIGKGSRGSSSDSLQPENEYAPLVQELGGEVVNISVDSATHFNPLDFKYDKATKIPPHVAKAEFVLSLCEQIMGKEHILAGDKSLIDDALENIYKPLMESHYTAPCPTIKDLWMALNNQRDKRSKELALALRIFATGSMQAFAQPSIRRAHPQTGGTARHHPRIDRCAVAGLVGRGNPPSASPA